MLKRCFIAEYEFGLNVAFVDICIVCNNFWLIIYFQYKNNMSVFGSN